MTDKFNSILIDSETEQKIKNNAPDKIPLNPTAQGWSGQMIRSFLAKSIVGNDGSILSVLKEKLLIIKNLFEETNADFRELQEAFASLGELSDIIDELTDMLHKAREIFDSNGKIKVSLLPDSIVHSLEFKGTISSLEAIAINGKYFPTQLEKGWVYITSNSFSITNRLTTIDIPIGEEYDQLRSAWDGWTFCRYEARYELTTNFLSGDMFIIYDIDLTEKVIYFGYVNNNATDIPLSDKSNEPHPAKSNVWFVID